MTDNIKNLIERLRNGSASFATLKMNALEAADLIEQQAARIAESESHRNDLADKIVSQGTEIGSLKSRIAELEAARIAYASEFPLNADGEPDVGNIHANIRKLKSDSERQKELCKDLANIMHDQTVAMQSALIEWMFGKGAESGLHWIVNTLEGPGLLPDTDAEHGQNAQFWFDTHRSDPFPKCFCGNPSHTLWMGQGFCCNEHYKEAKAKYDADIVAKEIANG